MDRPCRLVNAWPRLPVLALAGALLAGCSVFQAPTIQRGNRLTEEQLKDILPGVQTRNDVQTLLGSPTQVSTFGDPTWYYISSRTRTRPGREMAVTDQQTVIIEFDARGVVRQLRQVGEEEARPIPMVARETPVPGNERTLLQALFGNVGRVGPGANTQGGPGGGPGGGQGGLGR
jgi:outer membrane protein assembly factor BamE (lipoprotein component of BamABCDE complex)